MAAEAPSESMLGGAGSFRACPPRRGADMTADEAAYAAAVAAGQETLPLRKLAADSILEEEHWKAVFMKLWPHAFTLSVLAVYGAPILAFCNLARDATVQFWVGNLGMYTLAIPVMLVLCHAIHLRLGGPREGPVISTAVLPAVVLLILGNLHLVMSSGLGSVLVSKDCSTFQAKQDVQHSWRVAAQLYETCLNRTVRANHVPFVQGLKLIRLPDCAEYKVKDGEADPHKEFRERWDYLRTVEEQYACAGWCWEAVPLWTNQAVKDACSYASGLVLKQRVRYVASLVISYTVIVGAIFITGIVQFGTYVRKRGEEW
mmetsp:Transcript_15326/g.30143  ORF Transcript_15326/g.30143 Transcript_15326/m.30143 type:complete len:316 (+) Transcript_15326:122-1069(+)